MLRMSLFIDTIFCMIELKSVESKDMDLIYEWANDPLTRKMSFSSDPIPYEDHIKWFGKKLSDKDCHFYILYVDDIPVGTVRLDRKTGNEYAVSYSVGKEYRGKGYGSLIISLCVDKAMIDIPDCTLISAQVKEDNTSSAKCFMKASFACKKSPEGALIFTRKIK